LRSRLRRGFSRNMDHLFARAPLLSVPCRLCVKASIEGLAESQTKKSPATPEGATGPSLAKRESSANHSGGAMLPAEMVHFFAASDNSRSSPVVQRLPQICPRIVSRWPWMAVSGNPLEHRSFEQLG
jgi:hypothetical protein